MNQSYPHINLDSKCVSINLISATASNLVSANAGLEYLKKRIPPAHSEYRPVRTSFSFVLAYKPRDTGVLDSYGIAFPERHNCRMLEDDQMLYVIYLQ